MVRVERNAPLEVVLEEVSDEVKDSGRFHLRSRAPLREHTEEMCLQVNLPASILIALAAT